MKTMITYDNDDSTYGRLISAGIKLFSKYGYDATSTRMIAQEAGVNLSAISFHFSGKEKLFTSCLDYIAEKTSLYYQDISSRIKDLLEKGTITKKDACAFLLELVDLQISAAFGRQYRSSLSLIYWEHINAMKGYHPVTTSLFENVEKSMAMLLTAVTDFTYEKAIIASRYINGSIISFGEHSQLVQYALGNSEDLEEELSIWVRSDVRHYCEIIVKDILKI